MSSAESKGSSYQLVPVYITYGYLAAQVVKAKLESEGIPALLKYESVGHVLGITVDGLGEVQVMVPESLADEARAVLSRAEPISDLPVEEEQASSS